MSQISETAEEGDGMMEFVDCRTCKTDCVRADSVYGYTFCDKYTHPPITNADRIRAMSDEELANLLTVYSNNSGWVTEIGREICFERIHEWLQKPAENQKEYY